MASSVQDRSSPRLQILGKRVAQSHAANSIDQSSDSNGKIYFSFGEAAVEALGQLPSDHREIIKARLWGELTLAEIAELTGLSVSTVFRRYDEGLQLRNAINVQLNCWVSSAPANRRA